MPDNVIQRHRGTGETEIGWWAAIALSAAFHLVVFFFLIWGPPLLSALLTPDSVERPEEAVFVELVEKEPSPLPEEIEKAPEPLENPPPERDVLDEVAPPEDEPTPPPEISKTRIPPPPVTPPKVEETRPAARPRPDRSANAGRDEPQPVAGLGEAAASRLLGRSLGYAPGQVVAGSGGMRRDEEMSRYMETVRQRIRSAWRPVGRALAAQREVRFEVRIAPDGRVTGVKMTGSSGNQDFDRSVELALKKASPFPALPSAFGGQPAVMDLSLNVDHMR